MKALINNHTVGAERGILGSGKKDYLVVFIVLYYFDKKRWIYEKKS